MSARLRPLAAVGLAAALALAATAPLAGCGKSSSPSAPSPPDGTLADVIALIRSATLPGSVPPPNVDGSASLIASSELDGVHAASALFVSGVSLLPAGDVHVRVNLVPGPGVADLLLDQITTHYQGQLEYAYTSLKSHPLGIELPFDGASWHEFKVAGSGQVPALDDSVRSVTPMAITLPADGAAAPRNADLDVTWSPSGADTTVYVAVQVSSLVDTTKTAVGVLARDGDGATIVTAAQLGLLPAGSAKLGVARFRLTYRNVAGHKIGMACESTRLRSLTLN